MKKVVTVVQSWCDYPDCASDESERSPDGQDTSTVEFWVYVNGKGRKTLPITIELCETHRDELRAVYQWMQKFDQKVS